MSLINHWPAHHATPTNAEDGLNPGPDYLIPKLALIHAPKCVKLPWRGSLDRWIWKSEALSFCICAHPWLAVTTWELNPSTPVHSRPVQSSAIQASPFQPSLWPRALWISAASTVCLCILMTTIGCSRLSSKRSARRIRRSLAGSMRWKKTSSITEIL